MRPTENHSAANKPRDGLPELVAPAGDRLCARAAVENGADAIYFGLAAATSFNARARATNFTPEELPELLAWLHQRGVKGYVAVNTLVFPTELEEVEKLLRRIVEAGADAVIVQDLGVARLATELCPELPLHASTQMTLASAEAIRMVEPLGLRRVILPRELSIREIRCIRAATDLELEVFVHGALCLAYSGQCLASKTLGGRSGNRGQCAQPCRLPYQVICDGNDLGPEKGTGTFCAKHPSGLSGKRCPSPFPAGGMKYPLSTQDLAAYDLVPELMAAGVSAFKIEGRLKSAEYVAAVTRHYRRAIDAAPATRHPSPTAPQEIDQLAMAFSRGFSHGWLEGPNHKALVSGRTPAARGVLLGQVESAGRRGVVVRLASSVKRGDGVVFESDGEEDVRQGGRVYEVFVRGHSVKEPVASGTVELTFAHGAIDHGKISPGQDVRKTDDPHVDRQLRKSFSDAQCQRRVALDLVVEAAVGQPLRIAGTTVGGAECRVESPEPLDEALKHPLTEEVLRSQLGRLGKTVYELRRLDVRIEGRPMAPLSVLGQLRHAMVEQLDAAGARGPLRQVTTEPAVVRLRETIRQGRTGGTSPATSAELHVLCRSMEQIESVVGRGIRSVIVDLSDVGRCREGVEMIRQAGSGVTLATPRIQKPGEESVFDRLAGFGADALLVRNLGGLEFCRRAGIPAVADFSLNAANDLTVHWLREQGALRVTAACDLDAGQVMDLAAAVPPEWLEVVVYQHVPMFHTEHCVFCSVLSSSADSRRCGRPCRSHELLLRDRTGMEHPVAAEFGCRNTVYSAAPQQRPELIPALLRRGVRHFRVEFLERTSRREVEHVVEPYRRALGGDAR